MDMDDMTQLGSSILKDLKRWASEKNHIEFLRQRVYMEPPGCKDKSRADLARKEGNKLFATGNLDSKLQHKILRQYNESIAYATVGSEEMAKAYANKSALLLGMRKYKESISEAEKALIITKVISLKVKLLCRKAKCLTNLGSSENRSCIEKARFVLHKSQDSIKVKESLMKSIEKAQIVVDEQKLDIPKESKRKIEVSKIIADEERRDIWESVEIKHSKNYGRHIIAVRDFEPGEIILVEKPYIYHLKECRTYQYCYKCFNYLWTVVPCDHCWRMFCSEECKKESWEDYHNLECPLMSKIKFVFGWQWHIHIPFVLSLFFKAFKEVGSIDALQTGFKALEHKGQCSNSLDYRTILAAPTLDFTQEELASFLNCSVIALIGLAKFTTIFKRKYDFDEIENLMRDEAAIFVGCLLLKFSTAINTGSVNVRLVNPVVQDGSVREMEMNEDALEKDESMNPVINIMTMMTLIGCIPNVETCRTIGHKSVMFALQPIKAGTPLMAFNRSPSYFRSTPKAKRQLIHQRYYKCSCDCRACTENWPERFDDFSSRIVPLSGSNSHIVLRMVDEFKSISEQWVSHLRNHKPNYPNVKTVARIKNLVTELGQHFTLPSPILVYGTKLLVCIIQGFHSPNKNLFTSS